MNETYSQKGKVYTYWIGNETSESKHICSQMLDPKQMYIQYNKQLDSTTVTMKKRDNSFHCVLKCAMRYYRIECDPTTLQYKQQLCEHIFINVLGKWVIVIHADSMGYFEYVYIYIYMCLKEALDKAHDELKAKLDEYSIHNSRFIKPLALNNGWHKASNAWRYLWKIRIWMEICK